MDKLIGGFYLAVIAAILLMAILDDDGEGVWEDGPDND